MENLEFYNKKGHWYKKWWGITVLIIIALVVSFLPFYIYQFVQIYNEVKSGAYIDTAMFEEQTPYDMTNIIDDLSPSWGEADAPIKIVEFGDFNCPYCLKAVPILKELQAKYPDKVKFYWRNYPASQESSLDFAQAGICANAQGKFWVFYDYLFIKQGEISLGDIEKIVQSLGLNLYDFQKCMNNKLTMAQLRKDFYVAEDNQVQGTPTFFINGFKLQGVLTIEKWQTIIEKLLPIYEK